ncbi:MAG TPA: putative toxin-antitoxin system toxin component, PIN family [Steroidobacteraceae bacterium]|nr:putative toxin-antitoxin system toxin component, PIN family [Steroidobacteraceae bacterium]
MKLVLDTNVVIDWLVFDDAFLASFRQQVRARQIEIVTHTPALDELCRVLAYRELKLDAGRQAQVIASYRAQTTDVDGETPAQEPPAQLPQGFPRCRDPDDNPFLHLAWRSRANALVSRDKAVLKLARRSRRFGFQIYDVGRMVAELGIVAASPVAAPANPPATGTVR